MDNRALPLQNIEDQLRKIHDPDVDDYSVGMEGRLQTMRRTQAALDNLTLEVVETARKSDGMTWQHIGEALGVSRQAAHERYAHRIKTGRLEGNLADELNGPYVYPIMRSFRDGAS